MFSHSSVVMQLLVFSTSQRRLISRATKLFSSKLEKAKGEIIPCFRLPVNECDKPIRCNHSLTFVFSSFFRWISPGQDRRPFPQQISRRPKTRLGSLLHRLAVLGLDVSETASASVFPVCKFNFRPLFQG